MSVTNIGTCPFCGQSSVIETSSPLNETDLNRAILQKCTCSRAAFERNRIHAEELIEGLCGVGAPDYGFLPLESDVTETMRSICDAMYKGALDRVQFTSGGDKIKMYIRGGKVSIERRSENKHAV